MRSRSTTLCSDESDKYLRGSKSSPKQCFITLEFVIGFWEKSIFNSHNYKDVLGKVVLTLFKNTSNSINGD